MKTSAVIEYYGSQVAVARALGIRAPSVAGWGEHPPMLRQLQIERLTDGALRAEWQPYSQQPQTEKQAQ